MEQTSSSDTYFTLPVTSEKIVSIQLMGHNDASFTTNYYGWFYSDYNSGNNTFNSNIFCTNARKIKITYIP